MENSIYIAGKFTGVDYQEAVLKFHTAKKILLSEGWKKVINPVELIHNQNADWLTAMDECLEALDQCDAIFMLPCSVDSPGAKIELQYAIENNLEIYY